MNCVSSSDHAPHPQNKPVVWTHPPDCPRTVSEWGRAGASSFGLKHARKVLPQRQHSSHLVTSKVTLWHLLSKTYPDRVFSLQFPIPFPTVLFSLAFVIIRHTLFSTGSFCRLRTLLSPARPLRRWVVPVDLTRFPSEL